MDDWNNLLLTEIRANRDEIKALRVEQQEIQKALVGLKVKVFFISSFVGIVISSLAYLIRSKIGKSF